MVYVDVWTVLERRLFPFAFPLEISLCSLGGIAELHRFPLENVTLGLSPSAAPHVKLRLDKLDPELSFPIYKMR